MTVPRPLYPLLMGEPMTKEMESEIRRLIILAGSPMRTDARNESISVIKAIADAIGAKKLRLMLQGIPWCVIEEVLKDE